MTWHVHFRSYLHANTLLPIQNPGLHQREDTERTTSFKVEQPLPWLLRQEGEDATRAAAEPWPWSIRSSRRNPTFKVFQYNRSVRVGEPKSLLPVLSRWSAATGGGSATLPRP